MLPDSGSKPERDFAEALEASVEVVVYAKLPRGFLIPTPVGDYNPDWAIIKQVDGEDRVYMIRETKSTSQDALLRSSEVAKIKCGTKHFAAIGIDNFAKSSPGDWKL